MNEAKTKIVKQFIEMMEEDSHFINCYGDDKKYEALKALVEDKPDLDEYWEAVKALQSMPDKPLVEDPKKPKKRTLQEYAKGYPANLDTLPSNAVIDLISAYLESKEKTDD